MTEKTRPQTGSTKLIDRHNENDGYATVRLRELMAALPVKQRDALQLRYFAGLDYAEIAATLDCSQEGARANVSHALRKLKSTW